MEKQIFSDFIDKYRDAEMVVIGIGEEWNAYLEKQEYQLSLIHISEPTRH